MSTRTICQLRDGTEAPVRWACDLYCSHPDGRPHSSSPPVLKSCFSDENEAFCDFTEEVMMKARDIRSSGGLLFSSSTDPCRRETIELSASCVFFSSGADIPCHLLTKNADWILSGTEEYKAFAQMPSVREKIAIGFSFSGDECGEPGASGREERIAAMKKASEDGIRTYMNLEPQADLASLEDTVWKAVQWADYVRIGAFPERRGPDETREFVGAVRRIVQLCGRMRVPVMLKRSAAVVVGPMPEARNIVGADFSLFKR